MSLISFYFHDLSTGDRGVLRSPTIIVWGGMDILSFSRISFMNMVALVFGAYMSMIDSSS